ncbi:MAG TPA: ABC transporter permease [Anaerolineales bacterium]|nr:ABC transporter permease [Anaerolineales bacterium]
MKRNALLEKAWPAVPIFAALLFTTSLLLIFGANPGEAFQAMWAGAFSTQDNTLSVVAFTIPLLLASLGLLFTFTAGLWNIGIEGQIVMGAVAASWVALYMDASRPVIIFVEIALAMLAGALWAGLAGVLKTRGGVHEIFGGLALTNLAIIFTNYLISGPWQPPEGGSFHGTIPFPEVAQLARFADSRFALISLLFTVIAFVLVYIALKGTTWGLKLKALGKNPRSAFLLGVSSEREAIMAMIFTGALAGLAGAVRVLSWYDNLKQNISGGIGYLALLVVMLAVYRIALVPFISFFFAAVLNGSITLQLRTQLHSALGGILTGVLVLFVLLFGSSKSLNIGRKSESEDEAVAVKSENSESEA